jgi:hypothetical protein
VFHLPWLAELQVRPCSVFWAAHHGVSDPAAALERHLELNAAGRWPIL